MVVSDICVFLIINLHMRSDGGASLCQGPARREEVVVCVEARTPLSDTRAW